MPSTEAGRRLLDDEMHQRLLLAIGEKADTTEEDIAAAIDRIEAEARDAAWAESSIGVEGEIAEAVAAERARLAEAVRGLEGFGGFEVSADGTVGKTDPRYFVTRAAVLALLEPEA